MRRWTWQDNPASPFTACERRVSLRSPCRQGEMELIPERIREELDTREEEDRPIRLASMRSRRLWLLFALFLMVADLAALIRRWANDASLNISNHALQSGTAISRDTRSVAGI